MSARHVVRLGFNRLNICLVLLSVLSTVSQANMFKGSLSYSSGLYAQGAWANEATKIEWTVTDHSSYWHYAYTLTVPQKNISHMIIEVSPTFESSNIWNANPSFTTEDGLDNYSEHNGNPGMPDGFLGLKWGGTATTLTVEFDSDRVPVWGDFYSKDGTSDTSTGKIVNLAYNWGFANPDTDPTAAIADGSVGNHLLVPDSTVVPVPGALLLGMLGLGAAGLKLRKLA